MLEQDVSFVDMCTMPRRVNHLQEIFFFFPPFLLPIARTMQAIPLTVHCLCRRPMTQSRARTRSHFCCRPSEMHQLQRRYVRTHTCTGSSSNFCFYHVPRLCYGLAFVFCRLFSLQVKKTKAGHLESSKLGFGIQGCVSGGKQDEDSVCSASNSLKMCHISGIFRM